MSKVKHLMLLACVLGGSSVLLGAFAAHGLKAQLSESLLAAFNTGVRYQAMHALVLLFVGLVHYLQPSAALWRISGYLFFWGVLVFSGSLYLLALGAPRFIGMITPLGGLCLIVAWSCLFGAVLKLKENEN